MKFLLFALFALVAIVASERLQLVVMVKSVEDAPKLLEFGLKSKMNFIPVLPESKTPREKSEELSRLERYFWSPIEQSDDDIVGIQFSLLSQEWIEAAYVHGESQLPVDKVTMEAQTNPVSVKSDTPDFQKQQVYLNSAPAGVNMAEMFSRPSGRGEGVTIVDLEGGWDFDHEDLAGHQGRVIHGAQARDPGWTNHGSAVLGEMAGIHNGFGVTGLASKSKVYGSSIYDTRGQQTSVATALIAGADFLKKGDMLLIELHRGGPRGAFIAMEWWPDVFDAVKYATKKGVIVFAAAGNGNQNLDHADYNRPQAGFPPSWRNPFNRTLADSGSILCGAGAPPPGTNGRDHGPDRSRLGFSNYGNSVDSQGWGREVVTLAYGDLQRTTGRTRLYTAVFSGTSSASPIVVGAAASIQSFAKSHNVELGPKEWRQLLRTTGTPQTSAPGRPITERIGTRPDLTQLRKKVKEVVRAQRKLAGKTGRRHRRHHKGNLIAKIARKVKRWAKKMQKKADEGSFKLY